jgi:hypothetical protein
MPEPADHVTPIYELPWPDGGHTPDGPGALQRLAERIEAVLQDNLPYHGLQKTIAAEQSQATPGLAELGTPDRVTLTVPDDSLVMLTYECQFSGGGDMGLFIDDAQYSTSDLTGSVFALPSSYARVGTFDLIVAGSGVGTPDRPNATAQLFVAKIGVNGGDHFSGSTRFGAYPIPNLDGGEHEFSVRFASATVKERQLRVWAQPFAEE